NLSRQKFLSAKTLYQTVLPRHPTKTLYQTVLPRYPAKTPCQDQGLLMDLDLLLISNEFSQSVSELSDIEDELSNGYEVSNNYEANNYEFFDGYETTDNEHSNNKLVVSNKYTFKKKRNRGMNSKTVLEKQAELTNHPDVLEILSPLCVRCKHCKKLIKLKRNFDKSRIESYVSNRKCIKSKGFQDLREIFLVSSTQDNHYIKDIHVLLSSDQSKRLNDELSARSKWKIDQKCLCIRSSECETYTDQIERVCGKCFLLTKDQVFKNALSKPVPKPENRHFTPKLYFKSNPLLKFLGNLDIKELWTSVSYTNENTIPFWLKLAEKGLNGAFESQSTFKELCEIMIQISQCEDHNKGVQNLKYSEEITNFMAILSSLKHMSDTSICLENMTHFKRLADSMNYNGPVIAMTDNTKLHPRLSYSANLGCIIGSIFSLDQTRVEDYDEVKTVIQNVISNNAIAKQVHLYLLQ
ncbi:5158_t:CDS:2, partial [Cetraspora pellucida]